MTQRANLKTDNYWIYNHFIYISTPGNIFQRRRRRLINFIEKIKYNNDNDNYGFYRSRLTRASDITEFIIIRDKRYLLIICYQLLSFKINASSPPSTLHREIRNILLFYTVRQNVVPSLLYRTFSIRFFFCFQSYRLYNSIL